MRITLGELRSIVREESSKHKKADNKSPLLKNGNVEQMPWEDGKKRGVVKRKHAIKEGSTLRGLADSLNEEYDWDSPEDPPSDAGDVSATVRLEDFVFYVDSEHHELEVVLRYIDVNAEGTYSVVGSMNNAGPGFGQYAAFSESDVEIDVLSARIADGQYEVLKDESGRWEAGQAVSAEEIRPFVEHDLLEKDNWSYEEIVNGLKRNVDLPNNEPDYGARLDY